MSVLGEFRRIAGEAIVCLNDAEQRDARHLALELECASEAPDEHLSDTADRVMRLVEHAQPTELTADAGVRDRLEDTRERLLTVCRMILGHR